MRVLWQDCREKTPDLQQVIDAALAHRDRRVRVEAAPLIADRLTPTLLREVLEQPPEPG